MFDAKRDARSLIEQLPEDHSRVEKLRAECQFMQNKIAKYMLQLEELEVGTT